MINDRLGQVLTASQSYKLALEKCEEDSSLKHSGVCKKAGTNYAVTLEKLGQRKESVRQLKKVQKVFDHEVRVHNNLGIIMKR